MPTTTGRNFSQKNNNKKRTITESNTRGDPKKRQKIEQYDDLYVYIDKPLKHILDGMTSIETVSKKYLEPFLDNIVNKTYNEIVDLRNNKDNSDGIRLQLDDALQLLKPFYVIRTSITKAKEKIQNAIKIHERDRKITKREQK